MLMGVDGEGDKGKMIRQAGKPDEPNVAAPLPGQQGCPLPSAALLQCMEPWRTCLSLARQVTMAWCESKGVGATDLLRH